MRKKRAPEGFTLIEIIIAITLTAVLSGIVFSALRLAHRSEEKGRQRQEVAQRMRAISDRLSFLVRGAYPLFAQEEEKTVLLFEGSSSKITFITAATDETASRREGDPIEDLAGLKRVSIFSDSDGLKISEGIFFMEEGDKEYILDREILFLKFEYLEIEEDEESHEWVRSWDPGDRTDLPHGVRITFALKEGEKKYTMPSLVVPIRARAVKSLFETDPFL